MIESAYRIVVAKWDKKDRGPSLSVACNPIDCDFFVEEKSGEKAEEKAKEAENALPAPSPSEESSQEFTLELHSVKLAYLERILVETVLKCCGGSRVLTARRLGISERTLYAKLREYRERGVVVEEDEDDGYESFSMNIRGPKLCSGRRQSKKPERGSAQKPQWP